MDFFINYTEDLALAGEYRISYAVFLEEYPFVRQEVSDAFLVTINDPCLVTVQRPAWCPEVIY